MKTDAFIILHVLGIHIKTPDIKSNDPFLLKAV